MIEYSIEYLDIFKHDLKNIVRYISIDLDNKKAAHDFVEKVYDKIEVLKHNPEMYQYYGFIKSLKKNYRYFVVENYIVFYEVDKNKKVITVHRILYKRMNIKNSKGLFGY